MQAVVSTPPGSLGGQDVKVAVLEARLAEREREIEALNRALSDAAIVQRCDADLIRALHDALERKGVRIAALERALGNHASAA